MVPNASIGWKNGTLVKNNPPWPNGIVAYMHSLLNYVLMLILFYFKNPNYIKIHIFSILRTAFLISIDVEKYMMLNHVYVFLS